MAFVPGTRGDSSYYISTGAGSRELAYRCKDRFVYINRMRIVSASDTATITIEWFNSTDAVYVLLTHETPIPPNQALELMFEPLKLYRDHNISVTCNESGEHILIQTMVDGQPKAD